MAKDMNASSSFVMSSGEKLMVSGYNAAGELVETRLASVVLDGERLEGVYAELEAEALSQVAANGGENFDLPMGVKARDELLTKWLEAAKQARAAKKAGSASLLLLTLAACGGDGGGAIVFPGEVGPDGDVADANINMTEATVVIDAGNKGAIVRIESSTEDAKDEYEDVEIKATGDGGTLELRFDEKNDVITLSDTTEISGFEEIVVVRGTVDFQNVSIPSSVKALAVGSTGVLSYEQFVGRDFVVLREGAEQGNLHIVADSMDQVRAIADGLYKNENEEDGVEVNVEAGVIVSITTAEALQVSLAEAAELVALADVEYTVEDPEEKFIGDYAVIVARSDIFLSEEDIQFASDLTVTVDGVERSVSVRDILEGAVSVTTSDATDLTIDQINQLLTLSNSDTALVGALQEAIAGKLEDIIGDEEGLVENLSTLSDLGAAVEALQEASTGEGGVNDRLTDLEGQVASVVDTNIANLQTQLTDIVGEGDLPADLNTLVKIAGTVEALTGAADEEGSVAFAMSQALGGPLDFDTTTSRFVVVDGDESVSAGVAEALNTAADVLTNDIDTLRSDITGGEITATGYDTLVKISDALATLNGAADVTGSVRNLIGMPENGSGNPTGLYLDMKNAVDAAVTSLEGQITTLQTSITNNEGDIASLIDDGTPQTDTDGNVVTDTDGNVVYNVAPTTDSIAGLKAALDQVSGGAVSDISVLEAAVGVEDDGSGNPTGLYLDIKNAVDAAVTSLEGQITTLQTSITNNEGDIASLIDDGTPQTDTDGNVVTDTDGNVVYDVAPTTDSIAGLKAALESAQGTGADVTSLQSDLDQAEADIDDLQAQLDAKFAPEQLRWTQNDDMVQLVEYDSEAIRVETFEGDDTINSSSADAEIVAGEGGDSINLTTWDYNAGEIGGAADESIDRVIYQTVFDGESNAIVTADFSNDANDYRQGTVLTLTINGEEMSHEIVDGDQTPEEAIASFAQALSEQLIVDHSDAVVGFNFNLIDLLYDVDSGSEGLPVSDIVLQSDLDVDGNYVVPEGKTFIPVTSFVGTPLANPEGLLFLGMSSGATYRLEGAQVYDLSLASDLVPMLNESGLVYGTKEGIQLYIDANVDGPDVTVSPDDLLVRQESVLSGALNDGSSLKLIGADGAELNVTPGGDVESAIENLGVVTTVDITFPSDVSGWPTQTNGDNTTVFDRELSVTIDGETITANVVYADDGSGNMVVDPAGSVAALAAAVDAATADGGVLKDVIGQATASDTTLTVEGAAVPADDDSTSTFTVDSAAIEQNGVQQQTVVNFSSDPADYYEGGDLSVTIAGEQVSVAMTAGDPVKSVQDLRDSIDAQPKYETRFSFAADLRAKDDGYDVAVDLKIDGDRVQKTLLNVTDVDDAIRRLNSEFGETVQFEYDTETNEVVVRSATKPNVSEATSELMFGVPGAGYVVTSFDWATNPSAHGLSGPAQPVTTEDVMDLEGSYNIAYQFAAVTDNTDSVVYSSLKGYDDVPSNSIDGGNFYDYTQQEGVSPTVGKFITWLEGQDRVASVELAADGFSLTVTAEPGYNADYQSINFVLTGSRGQFGGTEHDDTEATTDEDVMSYTSVDVSSSALGVVESVDLVETRAFDPSAQQTLVFNGVVTDPDNDNAEKTVQYEFQIDPATADSAELGGVTFTTYELSNAALKVDGSVEPIQLEGTNSKIFVKDGEIYGVRAILRGDPVKTGYDINVRSSDFDWGSTLSSEASVSMDNDSLEMSVEQADAFIASVNTGLDLSEIGLSVTAATEGTDPLQVDAALDYAGEAQTATITLEGAEAYTSYTDGTDVSASGRGADVYYENGKAHVTIAPVDEPATAGDESVQNAVTVEADMVTYSTVTLEIGTTNGELLSFDDSYNQGFVGLLVRDQDYNVIDSLRAAGTSVSVAGESYTVESLMNDMRAMDTFESVELVDGVIKAEARVSDPSITVLRFKGLADDAPSDGNTTSASVTTDNNFLQLRSESFERSWNENTGIPFDLPPLDSGEGTSQALVDAINEKLDDQIALSPLEADNQTGNFIQVQVPADRVGDSTRASVTGDVTFTVGENDFEFHAFMSAVQGGATIRFGSAESREGGDLGVEPLPLSQFSNFADKWNELLSAYEQQKAGGRELGEISFDKSTNTLTFQAAEGVSVTAGGVSATEDDGYFDAFPSVLLEFYAVKGPIDALVFQDYLTVKPDGSSVYRDRDGETSFDAGAEVGTVSPGDLATLIDNASYDADTGEITLTAAEPGQKTFEVSDVSLDYQGVQQIATVKLDPNTVYDRLSDGTSTSGRSDDAKSEVYYENGQAHITIAEADQGIIGDVMAVESSTVSVDMVPVKSVAVEDIKLIDGSAAIGVDTGDPAVGTPGAFEINIRSNGDWTTYSANNGETLDDFVARLDDLPEFLEVAFISNEDDAGGQLRITPDPEVFPGASYDLTFRSEDENQSFIRYNEGRAMIETSGGAEDTSQALVDAINTKVDGLTKAAEVVLSVPSDNGDQTDPGGDSYNNSGYAEIIGQGFEAGEVIAKANTFANWVTVVYADNETDFNKIVGENGDMDDYLKGEWDPVGFGYARYYERSAGAREELRVDSFLEFLETIEIIDTAKLNDDGEIVVTSVDKGEDAFLGLEVEFTYNTGSDREYGYVSSTANGTLEEPDPVLSALLDNASYDAETGEIVLTSKTTDKEMFKVTDAALDYQGLKQIAEAEFSSDDADYYAGGQAILDIDTTLGEAGGGETFFGTTPSDSETATSTLEDLVAKIQAEIDGTVIPEVQGSPATISIDLPSDVDGSYTNYTADSDPNLPGLEPGDTAFVVDQFSVSVDGGGGDRYSYSRGLYDELSQSIYSDIDLADGLIFEDFSGFVAFLDDLSAIDAEVVDNLGERTLEISAARTDSEPVNLTVKLLVGSVTDDDFNGIQLSDGWHFGTIDGAFSGSDEQATSTPGQAADFIPGSLTGIVGSVELIAGQQGDTIRLTSADDKREAFAIDRAELTTTGVNQEATLDFSGTDADYYADGELSVTVRAVGESTEYQTSTAMIDGNADASVAALADAINAKVLGAPASVTIDLSTSTLSDVWNDPGSGLNRKLSDKDFSGGLNVPFDVGDGYVSNYIGASNGTFYSMYGGEFDRNIMLASDLIDYLETVPAFGDVSYDESTEQLTITSVGRGSDAFLAVGIEGFDSVSGTGGADSLDADLAGIIESASAETDSDGNAVLRLKAAELPTGDGTQTFTVVDAAQDREAVKQVTEIDATNVTFDELRADASGALPQTSVTIAGETITTDPGTDGADTMRELAQRIIEARDGTFETETTTSTEALRVYVDDDFAYNNVTVELPKQTGSLVYKPGTADERSFDLSGSALNGKLPSGTMADIAEYIEGLGPNLFQTEYSAGVLEISAIDGSRVSGEFSTEVIYAPGPEVVQSTFAGSSEVVSSASQSLTATTPLDYAPIIGQLVYKPGTADEEVVDLPFVPELAETGAGTGSTVDDLITHIESLGQGEFTASIVNGQLVVTADDGSAIGGELSFDVQTGNFAETVVDIAAASDQGQAEMAAEDATPAEVSIAFDLTDVTGISGYDIRLSVDGNSALQAFVDGSLGASDLSDVADSLNAGSEFDGIVTFAVQNGELVARTDDTGADATLSLVSVDLVTNTGVVEGGADPATAQGSDAVVGQAAQLASVTLSEFAGLSVDDTLKDGDYGFEVLVDGTSYTTIITSPDATSSDAVTVNDLPALMAAAESDSSDTLGALVDVSFVPGEGVVLSIKPDAGLAPDAEISVPAADSSNTFTFVDAPVSGVADAVGVVDFEPSTVLTEEVTAYDLGGEVTQGNAVTVDAFFADEFDTAASDSAVANNFLGMKMTFQKGSVTHEFRIQVTSDLVDIDWSDGTNNNNDQSNDLAPGSDADFADYVTAAGQMLEQFEGKYSGELGSLRYDEASGVITIAASKDVVVSAGAENSSGPNFVIDASWGSGGDSTFGQYSLLADGRAQNILLDGMTVKVDPEELADDLPSAYTTSHEPGLADQFNAQILANSSYETGSITLTAKDGGDDPMNVTGFETDVVSDENSTEQVVSILFFGDSSVDNLTVGSKITVDILGQSLSYSVGDDATGEAAATDASQFYAGKLLEQLEALPEIDAAASSVSLNRDGQTRITLKAATPGQDNLGNVLDSEITVTVERNTGAETDPVLVANSAAAVAEQQAGALVYETSDGGVIINDEDGEGNAVTGRPEETLERSDEGFEGGAPALDTTDVDGQSDDNVDQSVDNPSDNPGFYGEAGDIEATQTYTNPDDGFAATEGTPEVDQTADVDDGNAEFAGDPESTGAGNGVTQTHTNPDSGYDAADASPEDGTTTNGDEALSGSEPGQYVDGGLETDYLSGGIAAIAGEIETYDLGGEVTEGNFIRVTVPVVDEFVVPAEDDWDRTALFSRITFVDGETSHKLAVSASIPPATPFSINAYVFSYDDGQFNGSVGSYYKPVADLSTDLGTGVELFVSRMNGALSKYETEVANGTDLGSVLYDEENQTITWQAAEGVTIKPGFGGDPAQDVVEFAWDEESLSVSADGQQVSTLADNPSLNAQIGVQQPNLYETQDGTELTGRLDAGDGSQDGDGGTAGSSPTEVTDGDSATDDLSVTEDDAGVPAYSEDATVTNVFSGNAAADVITNFQVAHDVIGIEGALLDSTGNGQAVTEKANPSKMLTSVGRTFQDDTYVVDFGPNFDPAASITVFEGMYFVDGSLEDYNIPEGGRVVGGQPADVQNPENYTTYDNLQSWVDAMNEGYAGAQNALEFSNNEGEITFSVPSGRLIGLNSEFFFAEEIGSAFDLSTTEFGLVDSATSSLSATEISTAGEVASLLNSVFDFSGDTPNADINTTIFAVTASDDASETAIWAHTQSSADDDTVDALELNLLGTVETVGDDAGNEEFGIENFAVADGAGGWDILSEPTPV